MRHELGHAHTIVNRRDLGSLPARSSHRHAHLRCRKPLCGGWPIEECTGAVTFRGPRDALHETATLPNISLFGER